LAEANDLATSTRFIIKTKPLVADSFA